MAQIIKLQPPSIYTDSDISGSDFDLFDPIIVVSSNEESTYSKKISTEELYPLRSEFKPELTIAFKLLDKGSKLITEAINTLKQDDIFASDDAIQRFQALLPELFCCRNLGDGFGAIINAIYHSLNNPRSEHYDNNILTVLKKVVNRLYSEPFIDFEEAVEEIMHLENAGLEVEPAYFKHVADLLQTSG